jgi:hypothetical protein
VISIRSCGCPRRFVAGHLLFFFLLALFLGTAANEAEAQRRGVQPRPIPYSELEREQGIERLAEMRQMGFEGVHSFLFELRVMPRRGAEERFRGQMWGSRNRQGPVFRYEIWSPGEQEKQTLRFFVQNGFEPEIWIYDTAAEQAAVRQLGREELFTPVEGTDFTPFDLQMPFLFWEDFAYEGLSRVRGRSAHGFLVYPPAELAREFPWLEGVRMFLDAEFNALLGAELVGEGNEVLRSFNIIDIKGVDDEWIPKSIDYRDRRSGDKTRLSIQGAAMGLPEEPFPFSPQALEESFPVIPRERFSFF